MPRYFFNMIEGDSKSILQDSEGALLPSVADARKEAVSLARDIVGHGVHGSTQSWKVVVRDANGGEVLTVLLSEIRGRTTWTALDLSTRIAKFKSKIRPHTLAWLLAAMLATIVQVAVTVWLVTEQGGGYEIASAPAEGSIVAVRFVSQTSIGEITKFLEAYRASLVGGPGPGGLYRLRIADAALPQEEFAKIVGRMAQERVVEIAAAVH